MGVAASNKIAQLVYTHLLANGNMTDSVALFHADHNNLNTSNGLTTGDALGTALAGFDNQVAQNGEPISVIPKVLLVPPALRTNASELFTSQFMASTSTTRRATENIYRGQLQPVVEPRLSNSNYSGYSASTWFVMGDPSSADTLEVAFLNGKQEPTIENFTTTPDTLGRIFRVFLDVGVKSLDFRTMQKNTA